MHDIIVMLMITLVGLCQCGQLLTDGESQLLAGDGRFMDVSPPCRFAPCLDVSPPRRFAPWTIRPLDDSPHTRGRFASELSFVGVSPFRCGRTFCGT